MFKIQLKTLPFFPLASKKYSTKFYCFIKQLFIIGIVAINQLNAQVPNNKVVMISIDGTPDYLIDKYLKNGVLPPNGAFATMKKNGAYAETVFPVNIASTGPSHIAIFTGTTPAKTGIVANNFRKTDQKWNIPALTAFRQPIAAETIFQSAMRQGKKVMALGGVGLDNSDDSRKTDYLHMYPIISGPSLVLDLVESDSITYVGNGKSYRKLIIDTKSPSQPVFEITNKLKIPLTLYKTDSIINDTNILSNLTQIIVDTDSNISNGYSVSVDLFNWSDMKIENNGKIYNTSFRILKKDEVGGKYRLLMNQPAEVYSNPSTFLEKIQSMCGLWPGEPENKKQTIGLVSEEIWFEQIDRLARYSKELIIAGMKENNWDLLFGYFSTLDDVQHRYTLTNPRQIDYNADNGNRPVIYASYVEKYFQLIDRYLLEIMKAAPKETNFIIFSDHGMIPTHTTLLLNNYFEQAGFAVSNQELTSVSSGNSAHIYINKEKIDKATYNSYLNRLTLKLKTLKDASTGESIFELIANQEEQNKYGLYNQTYSGDLFVSCKPGYSISDRFLLDVKYLVQNSFDPAMFQNQNLPTRNFLLNGGMNETGRAVHGNLSKIREGQSIFYSIGPDVPTRKLAKIYSIQIAATVSRLLGIEKPLNAEGSSLF